MIAIRTLFATVLTALAFNAFAAVDANRAGAAELESVKGIGPALSAKIVEARKTGPFRDWTDMVERVPGVGPASAQRLSAGGLTVGGQPWGTPAAATRPASTAAAAPARQATPQGAAARPSPRGN